MVIASVFDPDSDNAVETAAAIPTSSGYKNIYRFPFLDNFKICQSFKVNGILSKLLSLI